MSFAPDIPGLAFIQKLGAGGYADVYLYEQSMPKRRVAVKVLRDAGMSSTVRERFRAEANAMAQLTHPNIVPVYSADTTEDGHPYIVMMYYPRASLAERVKRSPLTVAEALQIGIKLASAAETAHRAGMLHRDIKPANVLTDQYGNPGLGDFGIAADVAIGDDDDPGVSVPWSPPELLYGTLPPSVRSDVYSLAATIWHLLVGRSPFESPGGDNSQFALMKRIRDTPPPTTGRPDVPVTLERLLGAAMAKDPAVRPASALALAQALQGIEVELRLPRTQLILESDDYSRDDSDVPITDKTRVQPQRVEAQLVPDQVLERTSLPEEVHFGNAPRRAVEIKENGKQT
ncbi:MAG: serine/threonine protein kinase, partial [Actinomycetales bacterium]